MAVRSISVKARCGSGSAGWEREIWLKPDETVTVEIPLWPTSMIFNRDHRLRIHLASSSAPALEPNRQNGERPRTGKPRLANDTLRVRAKMPSHLVLPVAENH